MAIQLDQYQNAFGIDSRSDAAWALIRTGMSALPLETAVFEISRLSVKNHQKFFVDKLTDFFADQMTLLQAPR